MLRIDVYVPKGWGIERAIRWLALRRAAFTFRGIKVSLFAYVRRERKLVASLDDWL